MPATEKQLASAVIDVLLAAEKPGKDLEFRLNKVVNTRSWYEDLRQASTQRHRRSLEEGRRDEQRNE